MGTLSEKVTLPFHFFLPSQSCLTGRICFFNHFKTEYRYPFGGHNANCADPVQMPHIAASDQGLHCLLTGISMQDTIKVKTFTRDPYN